MDYRKYTDEELIDMYRAGDEAISEYLIIKYMPLIRKKTNTMYLIGGEKEDLIQEAMISILKAIRGYTQDKDASFFTFAENCLENGLKTALDKSNRKKHQPLNNYVSFSVSDDTDGVDLEQIISDQALSPEQMLIEKEAKDELFRRLNERLSPMERKVFGLYAEGNDYIQTADILGKTPKSIDNCLQRIRTKGKILLEEISKEEN